MRGCLYVRETPSSSIRRQADGGVRRISSRILAERLRRVSHYAGELLKSSIGGRMDHVPFKNSKEAVDALSARHIDLLFANFDSVSERVRDCRLRVLATTGSRRSALLPDTPTLTPTLGASRARGFQVNAWFGVFARAGTPEGIISLLERATDEWSKDSAARDRIQSFGLEMTGTTSRQDLKKFIDDVNSNIILSPPACCPDACENKDICPKKT